MFNSDSVVLLGGANMSNVSTHIIAFELMSIRFWGGMKQSIFYMLYQFFLSKNVSQGFAGCDFH